MAAATLAWQGSTDGASFSTITSMRHRANNSLLNDSNNPIVIPTAGSVQGWEKLCRLQITANASSNQLSNFKFLVTTVALGTGISQFFGFTSVSTAPTSANSTKAVTAATSGETAWGSAATATGTGTVGDFIAFQIDVASTASNGASLGTQYRARYDEA